jgi:replicative DNA helicase
MDRDEIFDLLVSERTGVNRNKFNTGKFSDYDVKLMTDQFGTISNLPLYIEDSALSGVEQIQDRVWQLKTDSKIGLVVVDYIQFVNPGLTRENREQQIAGISHGLRSLARETQLPMIVLSQLNDEGKLRESRVIAHNANVVMMVEIQPGGRFRVSVTKGRGIPCGDYFLTFDALFARLIPDPVSLPDSSTDSYRHEQSVPATLDVPRTLVSDSLLL